MAKFIEITDDKTGQKILVNLRHVQKVLPGFKTTYLTFSSRIEDASTWLAVREPYDKVRELIAITQSGISTGGN